jgi:hypothetical protein
VAVDVWRAAKSGSSAQMAFNSACCW